jgi:hypothetical protein
VNQVRSSTAMIRLSLIADMPNRETTFMYIGFAAIGLLVVGLAGWYFFISRQTADLSALDEGRGFAIGVPSFTGSRGSTAENIAGGFGASSEPEEGEEGEPQRPARLWQVNATPVAGAGFVNVGSTTLLRYVERSTGHVFDVNPMTGSVERRTNRLIPKVYEASVGEDDTVVARSINNDGQRETFVGTLGTTTEEGYTPLSGVDLGPDIRDIALTRDGIVFLADATDGGTRLIRSKIDGSDPVVVRSFAAGDFNLTILSDERVILVEKAASGILGHAYDVGDTLTSLGRAPGLTLLARASSTATLIGSDDGSLSLSVRANKDATLLPLDIKTVAEKCVWLTSVSLTAYCAVPQTPPAPGFLTGWYRGTVHTTDSWYVVDAGAGTSESFLEMSIDDAIDVERPLTDGGNFIAFINARDKSLWLLRIIE